MYETSFGAQFVGGAGQEMRYDKTETRSEDAAVKGFQCDSCGRELQLMVWPELVALANEATHETVIR